MTAPLRSRLGSTVVGALFTFLLMRDESLARIIPLSKLHSGMAERPAVLQRLARVSDVSQLLLPIATLATALWLWWAHYRTHDASAHGQAKRQPTGRALSAQELHKGDFSAVRKLTRLPGPGLLIGNSASTPLLLIGIFVFLNIHSFLGGLGGPDAR